MKLNTIAPQEGARTSKKRLGRGIGSGLGKTSGKGAKGQWARSGGGVRPGFEGGTMPLTRRLPKRGFHNHFRKDYTEVNVSEFNCFDEGTVITAELLLSKGIIGNTQKYGLKVLGDGEITKKLTVKASKFTKTAEEKIVKAGGKVEVI